MSKRFSPFKYKWTSDSPNSVPVLPRQKLTPVAPNASTTAVANAALGSKNQIDKLPTKSNV